MSQLIRAALYEKYDVDGSLRRAETAEAVEDLLRAGAAAAGAALMLAAAVGASLLGA